MPYVVTRFKNGTASFLGFDDAGAHQWSTDRLDAIRFDERMHAFESCGIYLQSGARLRSVDDEDGKYTTYLDFEIQVFKDDVTKPGGKRWRFRFGPTVKDRAYTYSPSNIGYTSYEQAWAAAARRIDAAARTLVSA